MALTEKQQPYEFLARWNTKTGRLQGAHVGFSSVVFRDGEFLAESVQPVMPVSLAGEAGFPLADILDALQADAVAAYSAATEELADTKAKLDKAHHDLEQKDLHVGKVEEALALQNGELSAARAAVEQHKTDISTLRGSLLEKDKEVSRLREDLRKKNQEAAGLAAQVAALEKKPVK